MEKNRVQNKKDEAAEELRAQQEYLMEMGGVFSTRGKQVSSNDLICRDDSF